MLYTRDMESEIYGVCCCGQTVVVEEGATDIDNAAAAGHIECIKQLITTEADKDGHTTVCYAAMFGHFDCVKWLVAEGFHKCKYTVACAARCGRNDILRWLIDNGFKKSWNAFEGAGAGGHVHTIEFLINEGGFTNVNMATLAASKCGHADCLKWIVDNDIDRARDALVIDAAALRGHFDCLQFLIRAGYSKSDLTTLYAARARSTNCIRLLVENGFHKSHIAVDCAVRLKDFDALIYMVGVGFPVELKAFNRDFELINACSHFLITRGFPIDQSIVDSVMKTFDKHKSYANDLLSFITMRIPCDITNLIAERYALSKL